MGRRQSKYLQAWNPRVEATRDEPCTMCDRILSKRTTWAPVVFGQTTRGLMHTPLQLAPLKVIIVPHGTWQPGSLTSMSLNCDVTPLLRDDLLTDHEDEATPFPLPWPPKERIVAYSSVSNILICATCYSKFRRLLEVVGVIDEDRQSFVDARLARYEQLIKQEIIPPEDRRAYVERRVGGGDRRKRARRMFASEAPRTLTPDEVDRDE